MKRLISYLRVDYVWLKILLSLVIGTIVYYVMYTIFDIAFVPTEKDFSEMESQIVEIQESHEILLESNRTITIKDGSIKIALTNKKMEVCFDKDFNVISKWGEKDQFELKLTIRIVSVIVGLFVSGGAYWIFDEYKDISYEVDYIRRKINEKLFKLKKEKT